MGRFGEEAAAAATERSRGTGGRWRLKGALGVGEWQEWWGRRWAALMETVVGYVGLGLLFLG